MRKFLKYFLITTLVILLCWGSVILFWRNQQADPGIVQIAAWLILPPLILLTGVFVFVKRKSVSVSNTTDTFIPNNSEQQNTPFETQSFQLLAWNLLNPLGNSTAQILASLPDAQAPSLDAELRDPQGFPILSTRIEQLDSKQLREALAITQPSLDKKTLDDAVLRAIDALKTCALPLLQTIVELRSHPEMPNHLQQVAIVCYLPAHWDSHASSYLLEQLTHHTTLVGIHNANIDVHHGPALFTPPTTQEDKPATALTLYLACNSDISSEMAKKACTKARNTKTTAMLSENAVALLVLHTPPPDTEVLPLSLFPEKRLGVVLVNDKTPNPAISFTHLNDTEVDQLFSTANLLVSDAESIYTDLGLHKPTLGDFFRWTQTIYPTLEVDVNCHFTASTLGIPNCTTLFQLTAIAAEHARNVSKHCLIYSQSTNNHLALVYPITNA